MKTSILFQTKNLLVIFCCVAFLAPVKSQTPTFNIGPANSQTITVYCDSSVTNTTTISNPTSTDIALSYTVLSNTLPDTSLCDYQFCNWQYCLPGIPVGTTNVTPKIPAKGNGTITFDVINKKPNQAGSLTLVMYETGNSSNFQKVTWTVTPCTSTGISEHINNANFIVYPNPAQDFVNVEITAGYSHSGSIQVYNLVGEKLMELNGIKNSVQKIDLQELPAGAYFVKYSNGEGTSVKKIFKTK